MACDCDGGLERPRYFSGQLLTAADFEAEQQYFLARQRRHNRCLHGWGVVCGLEVNVRGDSEVVVEPGLALDCAGNEIVVCQPSSARVPGKAEAWFVTVEYTETPTSPVPVPGPPPGTPEDQREFTRIREGFRIDVVEADPGSGHRGKGKGTPGCGRAHPLCIARIRRRRRGWEVELKARRRE
jgi:hypothetical protein